MERKLKILCLHGYRQSSTKFRTQTGGMRKILKSYADFTFVSAPHILPDVNDEQRAWWFSKVDSFSSKDETDTDNGFDESLTFIEETFKSQGPFHGVLGFSQGAALTVILSALQQTKKLAVDFQFAIIVSGFKSKCSKHAKYYMEKISLPSLHIIGESDDIVCKSVSEELAELFEDSIVERHGGGHHVPNSLLKQQYRDFINAQQKICLK